jgi:hypothetical protein
MPLETAQVRRDVGGNKFFSGGYMATLYNVIFTAIRGRCISDESASAAAAEVAELVEEKFTSTNSKSMQCHRCGKGVDVDDCGFVLCDNCSDAW